MDLSNTESTSSNKFKIKAKRRRSKMPKRTLNKAESIEVFDVVGATRLRIPHDVQVFIDCVIFEHVSFEDPWTTVKKERILDHIDLYGNESPFFVLRHDIFNYPEETMLIGYLFDPSKFDDWFRIVHNLNTKFIIDGMIKTEKAEMNERIHRQVLRPIGNWSSLGSETEVDDEIVRNQRLLYQIEIKSPFPKAKSYKFKMRMVEDARDGYVELLPDPRFEIENVIKTRINSYTQTDPTFTEKSSQTDFKHPVNKVTQYEYECKNVEIVDTKFVRGKVEEFKNFVEEKVNYIEECVVINNNLNIFDDDYQKLVKNHRNTIKYRDFTLLASLTTNYASNKLVTNVAWNYFESTLVAVSYSSTPVNYLTDHEGIEDEVYKVIFEKTPVHIWSYENEIEPKLYLEAKSDVSYLSFCPFVENILIGGGVNGQIFIWDLTDRISDVEKVEVLTSHEKLNHVRLSKLMNWCILKVDKTHVDPVYISPLKHSHTSNVVYVKWLNNTQGISPNGKSYEGKDVLQFMTFSHDGSVIVWDLNRFVEDYKSVLSVNYVKRQQRQNKLKHLKRSSFIPQGKTLIPNYKLFIKQDNLCLPIQAVLKGVNPVVYKPAGKYDENPLVRTSFKIAKIHEDYKLPVIVATAIGKLGDVEWFGYDYHEATNLLNESCQLKTYQCIHDGPIVACCVNPQIHNVILTVGGKIFAIWFMEEHKPLYWRKAKLKIIYNEGSWFTKMGSLFALIRSDGYIDVWNLLVSTERSVHTISLVGTKSINFFGGATQAEIRKNTFIVCDNYGTISVYILPDYFDSLGETDIERLIKVFKGQNEKIKKIVSWMEKLNNNYENLDSLFQSNIEELRKHSARSSNLYAVDSSVYVQKDRKISQIERMNRIFKNQGWKNIHEEEMFNIIMRQKKINLKELSNYRAPLEEAAESTKKKDIKIEKILMMKEEIFRRAKENIIKDQVKTRATYVNYSIFQNYNEIEKFVEEYEFIENRVIQYIKDNSYEPVLDWKTIVGKAKEKLLRNRTYEKKSSINMTDYLKLRHSYHKVEFTNDYKVRSFSVSKDLFS